MRITVALLSGGLDSTVAFQAALGDPGPVVCLTADYGQRAAAREIASARALAARAGAEHRTVDLRWLGDLTQTALCQVAKPLPRPELTALDGVGACDTAAQVWVPNRNGVLIQVAAALAEALHQETNTSSTSGALPPRVIVGFNREEAKTFPDNTSAFLDRANAALEYSTAPGVQVEAPTVNLDKAAIVALGRKLGAPLELVWVCYEGGEEHCGTCESCRRFERALEQAEARSWWTELRAGISGDHKHA